MTYETNPLNRISASLQDAPVRTGIPFWDMMLQMQRASTQALSSFVPLARFGAQESSGRFDTRSSGHSTQRTSNSVEVIPVGEETFHVGTHTVQGETTRLRRIVVETPVEQQVSLRTETVVVERRKPVNAVPNGDILTEKSVEMTDSFQVADTWKSVHLCEEVVLRTEITEQVETVRDIVRRDEVTVEHPTPVARCGIEAPKHDKAAVKAEADRAIPARSFPAVNLQDSKPAASQPEHKPSSDNRSTATTATNNKPGTHPRA